LCEAVGSDYDTSAPAQFTGEVITSEELELRTTAQAAGEGSYIPFAIISHGENKLGGISATGTALPTPYAGSSEATNATAAPTSIFTGPYNTGADAAYFDDVVITASVPALKDVCEDLAPAAQANTDLYDPFSGAIDPDMLEASSVDAPTYTTDADGNGVAQLTTTNSYLVSAADYRLATNERPSYISTEWTPDPLSSGAASAGFSIITRADGTPTGDLDNPGITFRFGGGAFGAGAGLSILDGGPPRLRQPRSRQRSTLSPRKPTSSKSTIAAIPSGCVSPKKAIRPTRPMPAPQRARSTWPGISALSL
jgi:hypothetical protein